MCAGVNALGQKRTSGRAFTVVVVSPVAVIVGVVVAVVIVGVAVAVITVAVVVIPGVVVPTCGIVQWIAPTTIRPVVPTIAPCKQR